VNVSPVPRDSKDHALFAMAGLVALTAVLWLAGAGSALIAGHRVPPHRPFAGLTAFAHFGNPSFAWHGRVGPAALYWTVTAFVLIVLAAGGLLVWRAVHRAGDAAGRRERIEGLANRRKVAAATSSRALLARASTLRPSIARPVATDIGYRMGRSLGVGCWASVEDSILLLGPPRSGKGTSIVIPMILDAPGAVLTTSTRPDNLAVTLSARQRQGPVAVFDPQALADAPGLLPSLRWSVVRGCERPQTAMLRAEALVADSGRSGVENGTFWRQQALSVVRCLLHAAAIDRRPPVELYRWSHSAAGAKEAVAILTQDSAATPGWDRALDSVISADQRTRDSVWAMVANTFAPLADPAVLAAVSPEEGEEFDPASLIRNSGTLYLLGSASGASATASLVAALVEDVVDVAKRFAARSAGARLDPPLALLLDEAANYPLPSLPSLVSEGGGSGITTLAVLQSLAQARDRWGREAGDAIWDSAIVKVILGGSANADDLAGISRLIGEREVREITHTQGPSGAGGTSVSVSARRRPILEPSEIRQIPVGQGLLLLRSAPPILMALTPWTARADTRELFAARERFETAARSASVA
jgi:type IV secretory pathway TraG/TraD family ATPase VirD4